MLGGLSSSSRHELDDANLLQPEFPSANLALSSRTRMSSSRRGHGLCSLTWHERSR